MVENVLHPHENRFLSAYPCNIIEGEYIEVDSFTRGNQVHICGKVLTDYPSETLYVFLYDSSQFYDNINDAIYMGSANISQFSSYNPNYKVGTKLL